MKIMELYNRERILLELQVRELEELRRKDEVQDSSEIFLWLSDNGWRRIGDQYTSYSNVYGKADSQWIIKVLRQGKDMRNSPAARCGLQWLRYAQKNWITNPHLPKVSFVKTIKVMDGDVIYVAVIEKLEEIDENEALSPILDMEDGREKSYYAASLARLGFMEYDILAKAMYFSWIEDPNNLAYVMQYVPEEERNNAKEIQRILFNNIRLRASNMYPEVMDKAIQMRHPLALAVNKALTLSNDSGCDLDMHRGNIMKRPGTGELVITDPVHG